jgi:regulator of replication initiation timing
VIGDLASEMAALKLENERLKAAIEYHEEAAGEARGEAHQAKQRIANLQVHNAQLESRIDWLMLEYCPEEMTEEQKQRWADSQEPAGGKGDG